MNSRSALPLLALVRARAQILRNLILDFRRDSLAKGVVLVFGLAIVLGIGYKVSLYSFRFIETFPAIGVQLNSRLLGLLFLVLFIMVTLSTAIVAYSTLFLARETHFFFEHPLSHVTIFFTRLIESIFFSGWATLALCVPVLVAFGRARMAPFWYYLEASLLLILFIFFCGFAGTLATISLLILVRRWTFQKVAVFAFFLLGFLGWGFVESFDFASFNGEDNLLALNRFTMNLAALQSSFFPSTWAASGILAASSGYHSEVFFNAALLLANTLIFIPLLGLYASRRYGRRWIVTAEPAPFWNRRQNTGAAAAPAARSWWIPPRPESTPMGAMIRKDLLSFIRDPGQVSQFILFSVLTVVYVLSLVQIPNELFNSKWRLILYFSNMAAISLILSSFTSRFLFPLISLECRAFWIIGLAPIKKTFLIGQKVRFGRYIIVGLGVLAAICSSLSLGFNPEYTASAIFSIILAGWVLTALAIGFGAAYPNVSEDNPARIAVGFGGTLNFFSSAIAVTTLIFIESVPYLLAGLDPRPLDRMLAHVAALIFTVGVTRFALGLGERSLARREF